ncbi:MAG: oligosaccharide flippase family protein [Burkholderiales bacterium]|jgi:O-antigen/teichoic acid export membrane protein
MRIQRLLNLAPNSLRRQLVLSAIGTGGIYAGSKLLMFIVTVLLARLLGPESYGLYATCMVIVAWLWLPTTVGLPTLIVRLTATYRETKHWELLAGLWQRSSQVVIGCTTLTAILAILMIVFFEENLQHNESRAYMWAVALATATALGIVPSSKLRGIGMVASGLFADALVMPCVLLALLGAAVAFHLPMDASTVLSFRVIASLAALACATIILRRYRPPEAKNQQPKFRSTYWFKSTWPLFSYGALTLFMTQTDTLLLAGMKGSQEAGIFQATSRVAELVAFSLAIINFTIQPSLARLHAADDLHKVQRLVTLSSRIALGLALPIVIAMTVFSTWFLETMFGSGFVSGSACLIVLCWAQVISIAIGPGEQILNMSGYERDVAKCTAVSAGINIIANLALIPSYGATGAAVAVAVSQIAWKLQLSYLAKKRLAIASHAFA